MNDSILQEGLRHHQEGRLDEAERRYREVLAADADNADALHFLGLIAHQKGDHDGAAALIGRALESDGERATFHYNMGQVRLALGDDGRALAHFERACALDPGRDEAQCNLGILLGRLGRAADAEKPLRRALELNPDYAEALSGLAAILNRLGRPEEAAISSQAAVDLKPGFAEALVNLGNAQLALKLLDEAEQCLRRAVAADPGYATAHFNLGNVLSEGARRPEAVACYRRALELDPAHGEASDNLLMALLYLPDQTEQSLLEEHQTQARARFGHIEAWAGHANVRDPDKRLRIGYVSPDFRTHSCAYFLEPLFAAHDRTKVDLYAYSQVRQPDETTARLKALTGHWRDIAEIDDDAAYRLITDDGIDILVDLAGHTANNRLALFAAKPAPVQVSWLGYPATTGLQAIDYRITDAIADPPGEASWHAEELVRLEDGFHCYRPPSDSPAPAPPPSAKDGRVTFASFNNLAKVTPEVIAAWARILDAVPVSRLVLKGRMLDFEATREHFRRRLGDAGVDDGRLELVAWIPRAGSSPESPLAFYRQIDIALDTFPFNGTTTTLEALWMGVPVITLAGNRHAGRVGASLLGQSGLDELIASNVGGYVEKARELAADGPRLAGYHAELRTRLAALPLLDGAAFARRMEHALREMWRRWCDAADSGRSTGN